MYLPSATADCPFDFGEYSITKNSEKYVAGSTLKDESNLNYIIDLQNFYTCKDDASDITLNKEIFKDQLSKTKDKGYYLFLMDYHHIKQLPEIMSEIHKEKNSEINFLSKMYIIEKTPIAALVSIQKFEKNKNDFSKAKILNHEMYEDLTITKPIQILYYDLIKSMTYMNEMYQYQAYLKNLTAGSVLTINIRENFWSDNIDFTFTICDSKEPELLEKRICKAIIVSKNYSKDFLYLSPEGNQTLCEQADTSRILLIRQNTFNYDSLQKMKEKLQHYILLFKFENCSNQSIPIMMMTDSKEETTEVFSTDDFVIRDSIDSEKKDTYRQLVFKDYKSEVQNEVKLHLTSKTSINKDPWKYSIVETAEKFKSKNLFNTLDEEHISMFYIKCILSGMFFVECNKKDSFPEKNFEVLILGAGCGTINHFFQKIFGDNVTIDSVDIDKRFKDIGSKYFGFKNDSKNFNWNFCDAMEFVKNSTSENKYDMVILDINNSDISAGISPAPIFYEEGYLSQIKVKRFFIIFLNFFYYFYLIFYRKC